MTAVWFCPLCFKEGSDPRRLFCPDDGTNVRPIAERGAEWLGKTLAGKYKAVRFVGRGGMADVFEVERIPDGKRLALKILNSENKGNERLSERFRREAMLISLIAHPNVVTLLDFGTLENNANFMVMELLSGRSLKESLLEGPVAPPEACRILLQVSEGMAAAHERGVIHRDIKPDNIFLQDGGRDSDPIVKILDLGIGRLFTTPYKRLTNAGTVLGTPEYMSPEQCNGEEVGIRSDIYALGVVLYELLLGFLPFTDTSFLMIMSKHAAEAPVWHRDIAAERGLPPEAEAVVLRALSKNPADRQESMLEFQRDVAGILSRLRHGPRYSVVAPPRGTLRGTPAPDALLKNEASNGAGEDNEGAVQIADGIFWVGRRQDEELECNAYLRVFHSESEQLSMLVDPGPLPDLEAVAGKVSAVIGSLDALNYIFLNHHDPDVTGSVAEIQRINPHVFVVCSDDTWRFARHLGFDPSRYIPVGSFPGGRMAFSTGHSLTFHPTPFCHFRGAVMAYDPKERVLFSGDLFGSMEGGGLFYDAETRDGVRKLHELYMPGKDAVAAALRTVRRLDPPPEIIAPQHGAILQGDQIPEIIEYLQGLELGMALIESNGRSHPKET